MSNAQKIVLAILLGCLVAIVFDAGLAVGSAFRPKTVVTITWPTPKASPTASTCPVPELTCGPPTKPVDER